MKARFVSETVSFERGKDPKESLKIGMWMEFDIQEMMERLVEKYEGSYTIDRDSNQITGTYFNTMFNSKARIIIYDLEEGTFHFSFPGMGLAHKRASMEIASLEYWEEEVDKDLEVRKQSIKNLGYNPFLEESANMNFQRGQDPKRSLGIGGPQTGYLYWVKKKFHTEREWDIERPKARSRSGSIYDKYMIFRITAPASYPSPNIISIEYMAYRSLAAAKECRPGWCHSDISDGSSTMEMTFEEFDTFFEKVDDDPKVLKRGLKKLYPDSEEY